jgi:pentatricopeptide repeat protein
LIIERNLDSKFSVEIAIVNMYGKCGSLDDAHDIFNKMLTRSIISFNALIAAYAQRQQGDKALALYLRLQYEGFSPDHITFISAMDACAGSVELVHVKALHIYLIENRIVQDIVMETALLNLYSKCGDFDGANRIFEGMARRDVAAWNAMIASYSEHGHGKEVVKLFKRMENDGLKPDEISFVNVLCACSHAGMTNEAREYFDSMSQVYGIVPTVEHYACMADVFGRAGLLVEAENFLRKMPRHPSPVAWLALLSSCKARGDVERARYSANRIFEIDPKHTGATMMLSNIFSLAGMWKEAADVIQETL